MNINNVYASDCVEFMKNMDSNSVDMVLTSPPYDNLRKYDGYSFDFFSVAKELYRVMKDGAVMVWVVGDQTVDGSETGESFRQALGFMDVGFKLHDTMIYAKDPRYAQKNRYGNSFEYMFVLSKGLPKTFNPLMRKTMNRGYDKFVTNRDYDGELVGRRYTSPDETPLYNIWYYSSGFMKTTKDVEAYEHPAKEISYSILSVGLEPHVRWQKDMGGITSVVIYLRNMLKLQRKGLPKHLH